MSEKSPPDRAHLDASWQRIKGIAKTVSVFCSVFLLFFLVRFRFAFPLSRSLSVWVSLVEREGR